MKNLHGLGPNLPELDDSLKATIVYHARTGRVRIRISAIRKEIIAQRYYPREGWFTLSQMYGDYQRKYAPLFRPEMIESVVQVKR